MSLEAKSKKNRIIKKGGIEFLIISLAGWLFMVFIHLRLSNDDVFVISTFHILQSTSLIYKVYVLKYLNNVLKENKVVSNVRKKILWIFVLILMSGTLLDFIFPVFSVNMYRTILTFIIYIPLYFWYGHISYNPENFENLKFLESYKEVINKYWEIKMGSDWIVARDSWSVSYGEGDQSYTLDNYLNRYLSYLHNRKILFLVINLSFLYWFIILIFELIFSLISVQVPINNILVWAILLYLNSLFFTSIFAFLEIHHPNQTNFYDELRKILSKKPFAIILISIALSFSFSVIFLGFFFQLIFLELLLISIANNQDILLIDFFRWFLLFMITMFFTLSAIMLLRIFINAILRRDPLNYYQGENLIFSVSISLFFIVLFLFDFNIGLNFWWLTLIGFLILMITLLNFIKNYKMNKTSSYTRRKIGALILIPMCIIIPYVVITILLYNLSFSLFVFLMVIFFYLFSAIIVFSISIFIKFFESRHSESGLNKKLKKFDDLETFLKEIRPHQIHLVSKIYLKSINIAK